MTSGPLMIDIEGLELTEHEYEILAHPHVGAVILFARNYCDPEQLSHLCAEIHAIKDPALLIAVDQEGGRVQRFQEHFTRLPASRRFGEIYNTDIDEAKRLAQKTAWLMATELLAAGVDFSFAPVLDVDTGISEVIGDRAFHQQAEAAAVLATAYMNGMHEAGMAAVGKHFPGHGSVAADSHHEMPVDNRAWSELEAYDLQPFIHLIEAGIDAIMPAHIIFSAIHPQAAGFSTFWLQEILRQRLGFKGMIFSDDLSMAGAEVAGDYHQRAMHALDSGCDMVLICNQPEEAIKVLDQLDYSMSNESLSRLEKMRARVSLDFTQLGELNAWHEIRIEIQNLIS